MFELGFTIQNLGEAFKGIPITLLITVVAVAIGLPVALLIAKARMAQVPVLSPVLTLFLSFMRGTPIIVQIFIIYNGAPLLLRAIGAAFGRDIDLNAVNPLFYAFIVYTLNASAGFAEMWKSGLSSVHKGQEEAALMAGLTRMQTFRHVVLPQVLATVAPSVCSITLNLLKNTSLVFLMTVKDITAMAKIAAGMQYKYLEGYVDIFITYLIVCSILEFLFKIWERRVTGYRKPRSTAQKTVRKNRFGRLRDRAAVQEEVIA